MLNKALTSLLTKHESLTPNNRRLNQNSDPKFSPPRASKTLAQFYKVRPTSIARKIKLEALNDEKNDIMSPTYNNILQQISEEPGEVPHDNSLLASDHSKTGRSHSPSNYKSIFQSEQVLSSKYHQMNKGPVVRFGKLIRHSIVGPSDVFERYQRRKQYYAKQQQQPESETSFGSNESAWPLRQSNPIDASTLTLATNVSKKVLEPKHKEFKKEIKVSKDQLFDEINEMKNREKGFYSTIDRISNGLRTSDMIYFTKEKRCLESYAQKQECWNKAFETTNHKLGRTLNESVVVKADEYREKKEKVEAFEIIKTDQERFGTMSWYMNLRKKPGVKEKRGAIVTCDIPIGFNSAIVDRPTSSLEIIRKPKMLNATQSTMESTQRNSGPMVSSHRQSGPFVSPKISERTGREYYEGRLHRNMGSINKIKAAPADPDDLMLVGENVLDTEVEAALKLNNKDFYPINLKRDKKGEFIEEVIASSFDKKKLYLSGSNIVTEVKLPSLTVRRKNLSIA